MDYEDAYNQLDYLINDSIKLNMVSDVPIGALLSGGLDLIINLFNNAKLPIKSHQHFYNKI